MLRAYLRPTDRSYLTAGMARTSGANDTEWRSQLAVLNVGDRTVEATATFRAAGADPIEITGAVAAGQLLAWDDVLGELFEVTDELAGSIQVDGDGPLVVTARTYNQSDVGTLGQFLPGIAPEQAMATGQTGVLSPLAGNQQFRTNVGYINLSDHSCEVRVTLHDTSGVQVGSERVRSIDPSGWKQDNDIFAVTGAGSQDHAYARRSAHQQLPDVGLRVGGRQRDRRPDHDPTGHPVGPRGGRSVPRAMGWDGVRLSVGARGPRA